ncbi:MAG TPA: SRPBCC family protein [Rhizomicrobium sp.]
MAANEKRDPASPTNVERKSDRDLVVTRTFNAPLRIVFEAWTKPELFQRWWAPKSFGITFISCQMDVRTGGNYRMELGHPSSEKPMAFFGRYIEVIPNARIVWTNDEGSEEGPVTTVTFEERGNETLVVFHDRYPSKETLDAAIASQATSGFGQQFEQLDALLAA